MAAEVSKSIFGSKCLNIFATSCLIFARQKTGILVLYVKVKITPVEAFQGSFSNQSSCSVICWLSQKWPRKNPVLGCIG